MIANTKLQVFRGTKITTDLGDVEDVNSMIMSDVPAFIRMIYPRLRGGSTQPNTAGVQKNVDAQCRITNPSLDIRAGDRFLTHDGQAFVVRRIHKTHLQNKPRLFDLERISGVLS